MSTIEMPCLIFHKKHQKWRDFFELLTVNGETFIQRGHNYYKGFVPYNSRLDCKPDSSQNYDTSYTSECTVCENDGCNHGTSLKVGIVLIGSLVFSAIKFMWTKENDK